MMDMNRRKFFGFTAGALAIAASPQVLALPPQDKSAAQLRHEERTRLTLAKIRESIEEAGRRTLFEPNDYFIRRQTGTYIQNDLEDLRTKLEVYKYKVVIDETNNPPSVVEDNDMHIDVYAQLPHSANYFHWSYSVKYSTFRPITWVL